MSEDNEPEYVPTEQDFLVAKEEPVTFTEATGLVGGLDGLNGPAKKARTEKSKEQINYRVGKENRHSTACPDCLTTTDAHWRRTEDGTYYCLKCFRANNSKPNKSKEPCCICGTTTDGNWRRDSAGTYYCRACFQKNIKSEPNKTGTCCPICETKSEKRWRKGPDGNYWCNNCFQKHTVGRPNPKNLPCANCNKTTDKNWRKDQIGTYYCHNCFRRKSSAKSNKVNLPCSLCKTKEAKNWRKDPETGEYICMSCAQKVERQKKKDAIRSDSEEPPFQTVDEGIIVQQIPTEGETWQ